MKFRLHWRDGKTEDIQGENLTEAFTKAGYGAGAVAALDFCEPLTEDAPIEKPIEKSAVVVIVTSKDCVGERDTLKALYYCSACGEKSILQHSNYCANCGAKIDWQLTAQLEIESPMCDGDCTHCSVDCGGDSEDMSCITQGSLIDEE